MRTFSAPWLLSPEGWLADVCFEVDEAGLLTTTAATASADTVALKGPVIPGLPNLHSHAFQRLLSGHTEYGRSNTEDSFWTWREKMYESTARLDPKGCELVARLLYIEMLEAGTTSVGEFHYLHHQADGQPYSDPNTMAHSVVQAARQAGLRMTLLPVFYERGGFGTDLEERQLRFAHTAETFVDAWEELYASSTDINLGVAPHSIRAASAKGMQDVLQSVQKRNKNAPVHIHIAEQPAEVEASIKHLGSRPVRWLLEHFEVDERWCLVHATFMDEQETLALAKSGAVAGICPSTEANLGDGFFAAADFLQADGQFGVGSDSQVCVSGFEELRLLEYGQRLQRNQRNVLHGHAQMHVGQHVFDLAVAGGQQALGLGGRGLHPGAVADFVVIDPGHPRMLGHGPDTWVDALVFGGAERAVDEVYVAGVRRVAGGEHPDKPAAVEALSAHLAGP